jgi:hypothetical protein
MPIQARDAKSAFIHSAMQSPDCRRNALEHCAGQSVLRGRAAAINSYKLENAGAERTALVHRFPFVNEIAMD